MFKLSDDNEKDTFSMIRIRKKHCNLNFLFTS